MRLASGPIEFRLSIEGYQYPEVETGGFDGNWLRVRVEVDCPEGDWTACDPALLTYEVRSLVGWLGQAAEAPGEPIEIGFIEPCLKFRFLPEDSALRVSLRGELWPQRLRSAGSPRDFSLEFPIDPPALRACAGSLTGFLDTFPERGD